MGVRLASVDNNGVLGPASTAANEGVCLTTNPLNLTLDNARVLLFWYGVITTGATTTTATFRLRRGTLVTSPLVNVAAAIPTSAAVNLLFSGCFADTPGIVAGVQYVLTYQGAGGSSNSGMVDGAMFALVL